MERRSFFGAIAGLLPAWLVGGKVAASQAKKRGVRTATFFVAKARTDISAFNPLLLHDDGTVEEMPCGWDRGKSDVVYAANSVAKGCDVWCCDNAGRWFVFDGYQLGAWNAGKRSQDQAIAHDAAYLHEETGELIWKTSKPTFSWRLNKWIHPKS